MFLLSSCVHFSCIYFHSMCKYSTKTSILMAIEWQYWKLDFDWKTIIFLNKCITHHDFSKMYQLEIKWYTICSTNSHSNQNLKMGWSCINQFFIFLLGMFPFQQKNFHDFLLSLVSLILRGRLRPIAFKICKVYTYMCDHFYLFQWLHVYVTW